MDAWVIINGNLTKDPVVESTAKGVSVTKLHVAVNGVKNDEKKTTYYYVSTFGVLADTCARNLTKGRGVIVIGELDITLDTKHETPRVYPNIEARFVKFMPKGHQAQQDEAPVTPDMFMDITSEDVPF